MLNLRNINNVDFIRNRTTNNIFHKDLWGLARNKVGQYGYLLQRRKTNFNGVHQKWEEMKQFKDFIITEGVKMDLEMSYQTPEKVDDKTGKIKQRVRKGSNTKLGKFFGLSQGDDRSDSEDGSDSEESGIDKIGAGVAIGAVLGEIAVASTLSVKVDEKMSEKTDVKTNQKTTNEPVTNVKAQENVKSENPIEQAIENEQENIFEKEITEKQKVKEKFWQNSDIDPIQANESTTTEPDDAQEEKDDVSESEDDDIIRDKYSEQEINREILTYINLRDQRRIYANTTPTQVLSQEKITQMQEQNQSELRESMLKLQDKYPDAVKYYFPSLYKEMKKYTNIEKLYDFEHPKEIESARKFMKTNRKQEQFKNKLNKMDEWNTAENFFDGKLMSVTPHIPQLIDAPVEDTPLETFTGDVVNPQTENTKTSKTKLLFHGLIASNNVLNEFSQYLTSSLNEPPIQEQQQQQQQQQSTKPTSKSSQPTLMITAGTTEQIGNPSTALYQQHLESEKEKHSDNVFNHMDKGIAEELHTRKEIGKKLKNTKTKLQAQKNEAMKQTEKSMVHSKYPSNFKEVRDVDEKIQRAKLIIQDKNTTPEKRAKEEKKLASLKVERDQEWRKSFHKLKPREKELLRKYINIINKAKQEIKKQKQLKAKTEKMLDDYQKDIEAWGLAWWVANPTDLTLLGAKSAITGMLNYEKMLSGKIVQTAQTFTSSMSPVQSMINYNKILTSGSKGFETMYNWIPTILNAK